MVDRGLARLGGGCALVGAALGVVFNLLHPRTTDDSPQALARLAADSDSWILIHTGLLLAILLVFIGLLVVAISMPESVASWARLAIVTEGAAGAIGLLTIGLDGVATKWIVDDWDAASGATKDAYFAAVRGVEGVGLAAFDVFIMVTIGLAPLLFGILVTKSGIYPRWIGSLGIASGASALVIGLIQFVTGTSVILTNVLFTIAALGTTIFVGLLGWHLWQSASPPPPASEVRQQVAA